jgi:hypothetical protein
MGASETQQAARLVCAPNKGNADMTELLLQLIDEIERDSSLLREEKDAEIAALQAENELEEPPGAENTP